MTWKGAVPTGTADGTPTSSPRRKSSSLRGIWAPTSTHHTRLHATFTRIQELLFLEGLLCAGPCAPVSQETLTKTLQGGYYYTHLADEKTEEKKGQLSGEGQNCTPQPPPARLPAPPPPPPNSPTLLGDRLEACGLSRCHVLMGPGS